MVVSEIEFKTPDKWLETFIDLEGQIKTMKIKNKNNWKIESGITKTGWYIKVLANKK
tara:strand:+ start:510 stop:680 length:171 start_codon:yes stop_codon:yes gene_type:complete